jgi:hypothetical protein
MARPANVALIAKQSQTRGKEAGIRGQGLDAVNGGPATGGLAGALPIGPQSFGVIRLGYKRPPGTVEPYLDLEGQQDRAGSVRAATQGAPGNIKSRPANQVSFWPDQPFLKYPWNKKFIPPLALFNDASQWVNRLMFNKQMTRWGDDSSNPPLKAQYFTPPPIELGGLAAGQLNLQLQLGQLHNQETALTVDASNYFGG